MENIVNCLLKPVSVYFDLTVCEPLKNLCQLETEKWGAEMRIRFDSSALFNTMQKQKEMSSPEIDEVPYRSAQNLRDYYLNNLC